MRFEMGEYFWDLKSVGYPKYFDAMRILFKRCFNKTVLKSIFLNKLIRTLCQQQE